MLYSKMVKNVYLAWSKAFGTVDNVPGKGQV